MIRVAAAVRRSALSTAAHTVVNRLVHGRIGAAGDQGGLRERGGGSGARWPEACPYF